MEDQIIKLLDKLVEKEKFVQSQESEYEFQLEATLTEEVKAAQAKVKDMYVPLILQINDDITLLKEEIKELVLQYGRTVKNGSLYAIWNRGRVSWDSKMLEGMVALIPELEKAKKTGEPTVSFRKV